MSVTLNKFIPCFYYCILPRFDLLSGLSVFWIQCTFNVYFIFDRQTSMVFHGTYWDHSLHRVAIPVPFKPKVLDKHVRPFVISITSMCNEHLEQHHACLSIKDEIHIECTLDPKHREVRQKPNYQWPL
jgi:hypothetical protein